MSGSPFEEFQQHYGFAFDSFQIEGCSALERGASVLVAAPTGAGKTVVGEFAAYLALRSGGRTFYTTPIKALSNQKYADFVALHGAASVGLLTGDNSLNGDAPVVVMTTEVLRNMIYEDSEALLDLRYVVLDEVHYLQDPYRGAVWEEILIHLPVDVVTVSLSATVSNTQEFAAWLKTLRGEVEVVVEHNRPVDILYEYFVADELLPMFVKTPNGDIVPNPRCKEFDRVRRRRSPRPERGNRRQRMKRPRPPLRIDVIDRLWAERMLPAIYFIFSRRGCDDAVRQMMRERLSLTTNEERDVIVSYAKSRVSELNDEELGILGYDEWLEALACGVAAHHAGMIPPFKEAVEELFKRGLVKVVFATETLALGINMPARTVVLESLMKFSGEKHELMTPGQYTQLSGRAGRRGIDEIGHSVVLFQRFIDFDTVARIASTRSYPLESSFQPSYNMAVNLVRNYGREEAEHLVNSSFAQFQADRDVVELERTREKLAAYHASYRERMSCDLGDFEEYHNLRTRLQEAEGAASGRSGKGQSRRIVEAVNSLRPGDVFDVHTGKRRGRYAVLEVSQRRSERQPRVLALSEERSMVRFAPADLSEPPRPLARIRLPRGFDIRDARDRRQLARALAALDAKIRPPKEPARAHGDTDELKALRRAVQSHPVHHCPEVGRHVHFADRAARLERQIRGIDRRIGRHRATLARRFQQVLSVLEKLGYVSGWALTGKGERLARVYNESDLLVVETLESGFLNGLTAPELAAVCSAFVYEPRGAELDAPPQGMPTPVSETVWLRVQQVFDEIRRVEDEARIDLTRAPDSGFALRAYDWTAGAALDEVLGEEDAAGDFVRSVKQLVDLLRQLEEITEGSDLSAVISDAIAGLQRGVVAYSSVDL